MAYPDEELEQALYSAVEHVIEKDFPNPNRDGCPGQAFLEKAAKSPSILDSEESSILTQHVPRCWPCFSELKRLRKSAK